MRRRPPTSRSTDRGTSPPTVRAECRRRWAIWPSSSHQRFRTFVPNGSDEACSCRQGRRRSHRSDRAARPPRECRRRGRRLIGSRRARAHRAGRRRLSSTAGYPWPCPQPREPHAVAGARQDCRARSDRSRRRAQGGDLGVPGQDPGAGTPGAALAGRRRRARIRSDVWERALGSDAGSNRRRRGVQRPGAWTDHAGDGGRTGSRPRHEPAR